MHQQHLQSYKLFSPTTYRSDFIFFSIQEGKETLTEWLVRAGTSATKNSSVHTYPLTDRQLSLPSIFHPRKFLKRWHLWNNIHSLQGSIISLLSNASIKWESSHAFHLNSIFTVTLAIHVDMHSQKKKKSIQLSSFHSCALLCPLIIIPKAWSSLKHYKICISSFHHVLCSLFSMAFRCYLFIL